MFALPSKLTPPIVLAFVNVAALPVVFAALSGISEETNEPILKVPSPPVVLTIPLSVVFNFVADEANVAVAALPVVF